MKIAGLEKTSLVDYPGKIAAVVFTHGCNYDCFYCHNRLLLGADSPEVSYDEVMTYLRRRQGLLDAVVVSGGEPLLQPELPSFLREVRALGFLIKLDTNGSLPERLEPLIAEGLIDYVAVDIKAPSSRFETVCGVPRPEGFLKTIALLKASGLPWEARTTMVPQLSKEDVTAMLSEVAPLPLYAVQTYRLPERYRPEQRFMVSAQPYLPSELDELARLAEPYADKVIRRG